MAIHLDDIISKSWEQGVPDVGGKDGNSNLMLIVEAALKCLNPVKVDCLTGKIADYIAKQKDIEKLEKVSRSLIGVKIRFKDGYYYIPLSLIFSKLTPKYAYEYAQDRLEFPSLSIEAFKSYCKIHDGENQISLGNLVEIYLTFESTEYIFKTLEKEIDETTSPEKLAFFYGYLKEDSYFRPKLMAKINSLSDSDYTLFIKEAKPTNVPWIIYDSDNKIKTEILASLTETHSSASISLKSEFLRFIKNKKRIELRGNTPFNEKDVKALKENNPDLTELTLVRCSAEHYPMTLVTSKIKVLTLDRCSLTSADWRHMSNTLNKTDLTLKGMHVYQDVLKPVLPKLTSLTFKEHTYYKFNEILPVASLSLTNDVDFTPQPYVTSLALDCVNFYLRFHHLLRFFPFLETFALTTPYYAPLKIDQSFFLKLHAAAPNLNKLVLNGLLWGDFPPLRTKFYRLTELDISRTFFFESNPQSLLIKLTFIFPNLTHLIYAPEDSLHNGPLLKTLQERFKTLKFVEQ